MSSIASVYFYLNGAKHFQELFQVEAEFSCQFLGSIFRIDMISFQQI